MKIFLVVDKIPSAIYNLALPVQKHLPHLDIRILPVHPKRADMDTIIEAQKLMIWADLIFVEYWKSGNVLKTTFPVEWEAKTKICFHHNPYDYDKSDWKDYKYNLVANTDIQLKIAGSHLIPQGIDLDFFTFNPDYTEDKTVEMTVGRIESKKGILEVAKACQDLGYKFLLVGRVSEPEYMKEIAQNSCVEFVEEASMEELKSAYYRSAIHVCNSVDNFESGTLPILESMACGVPVLTRLVGHVPDIANGSNMVVRTGEKADIEDIKLHLKEMMENRPLREKIRESAWETVKTKTDKIMARRLNKMFYRAVGNDKRWVSVIVPTFDRPDNLLKVLIGIENQTYPNIEVVVVDSGNISVEPLITAFRKESKRPIKYIRFENKGEYTLPKARNLGVQKALGEVLVFCDDRILMEKDAVEIFESKIVQRAFLWGVKDKALKGFVENFSCILRDECIAYGMFNERVDCYGGQTQSIRARFERNGFMFECINEAKASSLGSSHKMNKRQDIIQAKFILQEFYDQ